MMMTSLVLAMCSLPSKALLSISSVPAMQADSASQIVLALRIQQEQTILPRSADSQANI